MSEGFSCLTVAKPAGLDRETGPGPSTNFQEVDTAIVSCIITSQDVSPSEESSDGAERADLVFQCLRTQHRAAASGADCCTTMVLNGRQTMDGQWTPRQPVQPPFQL